MDKMLIVAVCFVLCIVIIVISLIVQMSDMCQEQGGVLVNRSFGFECVEARK